MKKIFLLLACLILATSACDVSVNIGPTSVIPTAANTAVPATEPPTTTPEIFIPLTQAIPATLIPSATPIPPMPVNGTGAFFRPVSLVLPLGLTSGISGEQISRNDGNDAAWWQKTPGHTQIDLEGYLLQGKSRQPQIYIFPGLDYAQLVPAAFESIHRLDNIFYDSSAVSAEQLPAIPFFNEKQAFASNIQMISFQNGRGIRFLTEYAQYAISANNQDLFYEFQGLTDDGVYYIIAIFPVAVPVLADTSDAGAPLPTGGVPYPYYANPNADMSAYYRSVADLLNATPPDSFAPTINQLDALIQSMRIAP